MVGETFFSGRRTSAFISVPYVVAVIANLSAAMLFLRLEFVKILCFVFFILWVYLLSVADGKHVNKRGIMDNINSGIKYAGQMMGINTAADVANLVAKAFAPQAPTKKFEAPSLFQLPEKLQYSDRDSDSASQINPTEMIGALLRMIGFDAGKLGALAINALLMIAQLIGNTLTKRQNPKTFPKSSEDGRNHDESQYPYANDESTYDDQQEERSGRANVGDDTPLDWILNNPPEGLSDFIAHITDQALPDKLSKAVDKLEDHDGQGDCIKLLMCKSAPFIWGMQKSVSNRLTQGSEPNTENTENEKPVSALFRNLPDIKEYRRHGDICERRYSNFCKRNGS